MNTLTSPSVDEETYLLLQDLMGEDGLQEIVQVFLDDSRQSLEQLHIALQNRQADVVGGICHRLKSSSKLVGALTMADLITELEAYRADQDDEQASRLLQKTSAEFAQVAAWLEQQLATLA